MLGLREPCVRDQLRFQAVDFDDQVAGRKLRQLAQLGVGSALLLLGVEKLLGRQRAAAQRLDVSGRLQQHVGVPPARHHAGETAQEVEGFGDAAGRQGNDRRRH